MSSLWSLILGKVLSNLRVAEDSGFCSHTLQRFPWALLKLHYWDEQLFNTYTCMHTSPPRSYTVSQTLNDFLLLGPKFKIFKTIHSEEINSPKVSEGAFKPQGTSAHWEDAFTSKQHDYKRIDRPARLQHDLCCIFLICSLGVGVLPHMTCSCLWKPQ